MVETATILVIEDNATLRKFIGRSLQQEGYEVVMADCGKSAFKHLREASCDLVLLDLTLGDIDGLEILKTIRHQTESLPVIIVSTCMDLTVKVDGFEIGCDDYITKPFYAEELISRVKRQLRRAVNVHQSPPAHISEQLISKPFRLDLRNYQLYKNETPVQMRKKLLELMTLFMQNPNQVFTKQGIINQCWPDSPEVSDNSLYVHIRQLRELVEDTNENPRYIQTVRGIGFMLCSEDAAAEIPTG